ncbi:uncharacterized protein At4g22758 [Typha angustifolia]|uniref:uncharacterized protein At4g22758 n=1 Tax=Typha angustifolia TaxID=59011 RepID=UPI003C2DD58C
MHEANPKHRRSPLSSAAAGRIRRRCTPILLSQRQPKPRNPKKLLHRSASEPILWTVPSPDRRGGPSETPPIDQPEPLPRFHTFTDVLSPFSSPSSPDPFREEAKVVVSVTVEGSPGPVRAMVRLAGSVEEAIAAVVERYGREGRSPRLDPAAAKAFQLHHSYFSLQSLNKSDKIGEVGGRSFFLRKNNGTNSFMFEREASESEMMLFNGRSLAVSPIHFFLSFIAKRLNKIGRRTRKLWSVVTCIGCV